VTSKEIVLRAIERSGPPRVPINYCNRDFESSDVLCTGWAEARDFVSSEPGMNEWGYAWASLDRTMGQPHTHPLADWSRIESYAPPNPYAPGRLDHISGWATENRDRFLRFSVGISGFNQATFLRGFETFLMDLCEAPERAERVLDIVFGVENALIDQVADAPVDAISFADDWGTQNGLMISIGQWRSVFRPRYSDQFARVHNAGKKVWFHTCGNVWPIIGDLIDAGVDVIELLQPDIFGVERLASEFGGRVCFCCSVDHQRRAVSGTRDEIMAYTRLLRDRLGSFNGGFIGYVEDYASLGMTERSYQWIREAFHGLEPY
jgi:uroporphyrinogen decarboxylase